MSLHHLGERIDIHGGGSDLIYPHHENEIAQSEACTGKRPFVRWWMHVAAVRLNAAKMSKSDGNMVFVRDALERASPQAVRLYLLDLHYRRPFDHEDSWLARSVDRQRALAARLGEGPVGPIGRDRPTRAVLAALDRDLDTAGATRELERQAKNADPAVRASLRGVGRHVLGVI